MQIHYAELLDPDLLCLMGASGGCGGGGGRVGWGAWGGVGWGGMEVL